MREHEWTRVLGWPGYKVYRMEIDERSKHLKLWVRRMKTLLDHARLDLLQDQLAFRQGETDADDSL